MGNLSEWDINIEATTHCFMSISCEAKENARAWLEKSTQNKESMQKVLVLNLADNDIHEIPSDMCFIEKGSDSHSWEQLLVQFNMIAVHKNDRDYRFVSVAVTNDEAIRLRLYDSTTKCSMTFDDIFVRLENERSIWLDGSCCATFDRVFILNVTTGTCRLCYLSSFSYVLMGDTCEIQMDVDIEFPDCVLSRLYNVEFITTNDSVFVLGSGCSDFVLWHVDLEKGEFVECDNFAISGVLAVHLSYVASYSDYLIFGPEMDKCLSLEDGRCSITGFRLFDLKRKEWRELIQIKDKLISESTSGLEDCHLEYYYDPVVQSFNDPQ